MGRSDIPDINYTFFGNIRQCFVDPTSLPHALSLKHYGDVYGIEFPEYNDKRDMLMYVITYARQIIYDTDN